MADLSMRSLQRASLTVGGAILLSLAILIGWQILTYGSMESLRPVYALIERFALFYCFMQFVLLASGLYRRGKGRQVVRSDFTGWTCLLLSVVAAWLPGMALSQVFTTDPFLAFVTMVLTSLLTFAGLSILLGIVYAVGRLLRPSSKEIN